MFPVSLNVVEREEIDYRGSKLIVSMETEENNGWDGKTVLVTGPKMMSHETLELIFESKKKSGGGPIESIQIEEGLGAIITFENKNGKLKSD